MVEIGCIIVNYRNAETAIRLAKQLETLLGPSKRIYVVENGTGPEEVERLRAALNEEQIVTIKENLGYAGGMNAGIKKALQDGAEYLWLLTKDLTVETDCLQTLVNLWPRLDRPGFLGSLTDLNGTEQVYFFRSKIDSNGRVKHGNKGRTVGEIPELSAEYGRTDYVNGACVFTHRDVIENVGLIPEDYFLYYEDCEWGLRAERKGYKNYVSYRSRVHHHRPVGAFSATAEYYCRKNAYFFRKRNGYSGTFDKIRELLRLKKAQFKSWLTKDTQLLEVLRAVSRDVRDEKMGLGPWR
jgi:GT2 family glycosyltransferase